MKFLDDDFFLNSKAAKELYHDYAEQMPIFDFHCHLSPKEIAEDLKYDNITQVWLGGDHYKWRAMRANGVEEKYITGDAPDKEKFLKWAEVMPYTVGNPMYIWSHLELKRYFGVDKLLSPETAEEIWDACNAKLQGGLSARKLITGSNVKFICTTDNPVDSLEYHKALKADKTFPVTVVPASRPDPFLRIENADFTQWVEKLAKAAGTVIHSYADLKKALHARVEYFHTMGCRLSDHALDRIAYAPADDAEVSAIFDSAMNGKTLTAEEGAKYRTALLIFLGSEYAAHGWAQQYHINALRNNNTPMFKKLGPDTGYDATADYPVAEALAKLLDAQQKAGALPKTILYSLNSNDYEPLVTIAGCFNSSEVPGKMQLGSSWWFNDQKDGIEKQLISLANVGLLSRFVGMLTDSRSFLSYTRHEYFRRVLCNIIGGWADRGEVPDDKRLLGRMVQDICYNNAVNYFKVNAK